MIGSRENSLFQEFFFFFFHTKYPHRRERIWNTNSKFELNIFVNIDHSILE